MRLFDTARRAVVDFAPGKTVNMYVCGITPYDSAHLGHVFTFLTYDLLIRRLRGLGHEVFMTRNITDVDDPLFERAREMGVDYRDLAASQTEHFNEVMEAFGFIRPSSEPTASGSVEGMIEAISRLIESGHAYAAGGYVFFAARSAPDFGRLGRLAPGEMLRLARETGEPDHPAKKDPEDFVLWRPSAQDEPVWEAPFGPGRPGWHIECSVMALQAGGPTLDLHGGGTDLISPHHDCEIAQSEALTGEPFARHWLHSAMILYRGQKMSKSLGNLVFAGRLLESTPAAAVRIALLRHHYRAEFEWKDSEAAEGLEIHTRILQAARARAGPDPAPFASRLEAALDDDLNSPLALQALDELASGILEGGADPSAPAELQRMCGLLGIGLEGSAARPEPG